MKKSLQNCFWILLVIVIFIGGGAIIQNSSAKEMKEFRECKFLGGTSSECDTPKNRACFYKCDELTMDYFKYDSGGFGSDECWCKDDDNEIKQIY